MSVMKSIPPSSAIKFEVVWNATQGAAALFSSTKNAILLGVKLEVIENFILSPNAVGDPTQGAHFAIGTVANPVQIYGDIWTCNTSTGNFGGGAGNVSQTVFTNNIADILKPGDVISATTSDSNSYLPTAGKMKITLLMWNFD